MNICTGIPQNGSCCGTTTTATLGTFDGVHIAHRSILEKVLDHANKSGDRSAVITFDRHPSQVLNPKKAPKLLTTLDEKLALFKEIGIDTVYVIPFTAETAEMDPDSFIARFLVKCLGIRYFIVGYDHGFGKNRLGTADVLNDLAFRYGFTLEIQPPVTFGGNVVNSSEIRRLIDKGHIESANTLLGRVYSFAGTVIHGLGIGTKIGIPTANVQLSNTDKILPKHGVYAGWIQFDEQNYPAVICIGPRLTMDSEVVSIEAHAPGFNGVLYGKEARLGFSKRLRDIRKFVSTEELVEQIQKDIESMNQLIPL